MTRKLLFPLLAAFVLAACDKPANVDPTDEDKARRAYQSRAYSGRIASE